MGWTSTHKPKGQSLKDFFEDEFRWADHPEAGLLDIASRGFNRAYAAVRHPQGYVFAVVILIQYSKGYHNITFKTVDESSGPSDNNCPKRILDQLTPDDELINNHSNAWEPNGHWLEWRNLCRANLAEKKSRPKVRDGDIIRFENPLNFTNGTSADTFVLRRESTFRGGTRTRFHGTIHDTQGNIRESTIYRYQITKWKDRPHRVIGHSPRA